MCIYNEWFSLAWNKEFLNLSINIWHYVKDKRIETTACHYNAFIQIERKSREIITILIIIQTWLLEHVFFGLFIYNGNRMLIKWVSITIIWCHSFKRFLHNIPVRIDNQPSNITLCQCIHTKTNLSHLHTVFIS